MKEKYTKCQMKNKRKNVIWHNWDGQLLCVFNKLEHGGTREQIITTASKVKSPQHPSRTQLCRVIVLINASVCITHTKITVMCWNVEHPYVCAGKDNYARPRASFLNVYSHTHIYTHPVSAAMQKDRRAFKIKGRWWTHPQQKSAYKADIQALFCPV